MAKFSDNSKRKLSEVHGDLQTIFNEVIKHFDCIVCVGHRGKEDQDKAFAEKKSKLKWPNSKHNSEPSMAIDVMPFPLDWTDTMRIHYFAGFVLGVADMLRLQGKITHSVRWGGDWKMNNLETKNSFPDLNHFELVEAK